MEDLAATLDQSSTKTLEPPPLPPAFEISGSPRASAEPKRQLRDNLSGQELLELLESADEDMRLIASGRVPLDDPQEKLKEIAKLKLEASLLLQQLDGGSNAEKSAGVRGQLQALSHLTAMGDGSSIKALRSLAEDHLDSEDLTVSGDSRIVLIGLAMDRFRTGEEKAAGEIVSLVAGMTRSPETDVPAVLVMAEARQFLNSYGLINEAATVRKTILGLFQDASDPMIAKIAADAAGTAKFDMASRLLKQIIQNDGVAIERWSVAADELIDQAPDINTVQFLCGAALQLEAAGRNQFVEETFKLLSEGINAEGSAAADEVRTAMSAMEARRDIVGTKFDFSLLPTVDGESISASTYRDKIVLMPFWAIAIPESLGVVKELLAIQATNPDRIAVVGMNLDSELAPLEEFLAQTPLGFPSYQSASSVETGANPVAARFGTVSLPFVVVFDATGRVSALDFTGGRVESAVAELSQSDGN
ncbi:MAG: TlpA disulfide reductase family protein [Planctomycetota bacterium]